MIKHAWTVVCQKSITDKETNNISLDILEQLNIQPPVLPSGAKGMIFPMQIEIISLWYRDRAKTGVKGKGRLKIEAPVNGTVGTTDIEIDLTKNHRVRTRARLTGIPIPKDVTGYFYFVTEIELNGTWIEVARIPLEINIQNDSI